MDWHLCFVGNVQFCLVHASSWICYWQHVEYDCTKTIKWIIIFGHLQFQISQHIYYSGWLANQVVKKIRRIFFFFFLKYNHWDILNCNFPFRFHFVMHVLKSPSRQCLKLGLLSCQKEEKETRCYCVFESLKCIFESDYSILTT